MIGHLWPGKVRIGLDGLGWLCICLYMVGKILKGLKGSKKFGKMSIVLGRFWCLSKVLTDD